MKKLFVILLIMRIGILPRVAMGSEGFTPPPFPSAVKHAGVMEGIAFTALFLTAFYSAYKVFFDKEFFYRDAKTGDCFVYYNGKLTKLSACPTGKRWIMRWVQDERVTYDPEDFIRTKNTQEKKIQKDIKNFIRKKQREGE